MSLESLRQLRRGGRKPDAVITLLVGRRPQWKIDSPDFVHIDPDEDLSGIDWRPLIGLPVALFLTCDDYPLAARVMEATEAVGVKFYGAAGPDGTHPCIANPTNAHHANLRKTWELLCR